MIRDVASAGRNVTTEDVRTALDAVAPEGDAMIGAIAQEWLQQGLQQGERSGEQRGLRWGLLDGIELGLELRFGLEGLRLLPEMAQDE